MCDNNLIITDSDEYCEFIDTSIAEYRVIASYAYPDLESNDIDFMISGILANAAVQLKTLLDIARNVGVDCEYIDGVRVLSEELFDDMINELHQL